VLIVAAAFAAAFFMSLSKDGGETIDVYLFDSVSGKLAKQKVPLVPGERETQIADLFHALKGDPDNKMLVKPIPDNVNIESTTLENGELSLYLTNYNSIIRLKEPYARMSLTWTLTELPYVTSIKIFSDGHEITDSEGQPLGGLSRFNTAINPELTSEKIVTRRLRLYFADSTATSLVAEERFAEVRQGAPPEQQALEQLIKGPQTSGLYRTLPENVKISNVKTEDKTCYIDLSKQFSSRLFGADELLAVYSIVNTLTDPANFEGIELVQFTVDGKKIANYGGKLDITNPFSRNDEIISHPAQP
jgi:germination protein M